MTFVVEPTRAAAAIIGKLPRADKKRLKQIVTQLEHSGCAAAGYRLKRGAEDSGLCCRHLGRDGRVIFMFPDGEHVTICWLGRHNDDTNVYAELAGVSDEISEEGRTKREPCCIDAAEPPTVSDETQDFFLRLHTRNVG